MEDDHRARSNFATEQHVFPGRNARRSAAATCQRLVPLLSFLLSLFFTAALSAEPGKRLYGVVYLGDLPTLMAEEQGYFEQADLGLEVRYGRSGLNNLALLRDGETDFALMALTPLVLDLLNNDGRARANDPVILADISHSIGLDHVVVRADIGIDEPGDLAGRRIGVMYGTNAELLLSFFMAYNGIAPDAVELVDLPIDEIVHDMRGGDLKAGVLWEPWASTLEHESEVPFRRFPVSSVYTARWVLVARREVIETSPDYCRRVLRAYKEAIDYMDRNPEEAIAVYAEHSRLPVDMVRVRWDGLIYGLSLSWSLLTGVQQEAAWAIRAGYAPPDQRLSPLSFIAPEPLRELLPAAVTLPPSVAEEDMPR